MKDSLLADTWRRLRIVFSDPQLEAAFRLDYYAKAVRPLRWVLLVVLAFLVIMDVALWSGATELFEASELAHFDAPLVALSRWYVTCVEIPLTVIAIALSYRPGFARIVQPVTASCGLVVLGSVSLGVILIPRSVPIVLGGMVIAIGLLPLYAGSRLRPPWAALVGWAVSLPFLLTVWVDALVGAPELIALTFWLLFSNTIGLLICRQIEQYARQAFLQLRTIAEQREAIARERERSERLLRNVLPDSVATRLKDGEALIADTHAEVSVLFADIVGFTRLSEHWPPPSLVAMLNELFSRFDRVAASYGLEKIKTIGDAYMLAAGLPAPRTAHAEAILAAALELRQVVVEFRARTGAEVEVRIGVASGPVVAGVIGEAKFAYDLWGDTVNTASRMESHGLAGEIQVAPETYRLALGRFDFSERGVVPIKGKGEMKTYLLRGGGD